MRLISQLFVLLTAPGVIIHEIAHREFCRYFRIPVKESCYVQLQNPPGYVIHGKPRRYTVAIFISLAPLLVNVVVAILCGWAFAVTTLPVADVQSLLQRAPKTLILPVSTAWLGLSAGIHALPSDQDATSLWGHTRENWYNPLVFITIPLIGSIYLVNRLRQLQVHVLLGVAAFMAGAYIGMTPGFYQDVIVRSLELSEQIANQMQAAQKGF